MTLDYREFVIGEFAWFVENLIGNAQFADVVQERGAANGHDFVFIQSHQARDAHSGFGDALRMKMRPRRFRVDDGSEAFAHFGQAFAVGNDVFAWLQAQHQSARRFQIRQVVPQLRIVFKAARGTHDFGIEPASAALFYDIERGFHIECFAENFQSLANAENAAEQRNASATQFLRITAPVPAFIQVVNRQRRAFRKPQFARDGSAAVATNLNQLARLASSAQRDLSHARTSLQQRFANRDISTQIIEAFEYS